MSPKISVVTTFYNYGRYLAQCIESVLNQTETDFELILYDDGSQDNSLNIAMSYLNDPRVVVVQAEHKNRAIALARAMAKAKGQYVGWLDADDWIASDCLQLTSDILDKNLDVGLVYTQYNEIEENGEFRGLGHKCLVPYMGRDTLLAAFMTFHFRLFRISLYNQVDGINTALTSAIDYDFCLRASEVSKFYHLEQPLYYYRIHSKSMSYKGRLDQDRCAEIAKRNALKRRGYI